MKSDITGLALASNEFEELCRSRACRAKAMVICALEGQLPAGYETCDNPLQMYGDALLRIRPVLRLPPYDRSIHFHHRIFYRSRTIDGGPVREMTREIFSASCDILDSHRWVSDEGFGEGGYVRAQVMGGDLSAAVRAVVSEICALPPFVQLVWRPCAHDPKGKRELYAGDQKMGSVWSFKRMWGTTVGNSHSRLTSAQAEVEGSARLAMRSAHQERMAGLGDIVQFAGS